VRHKIYAVQEADAGGNENSTATRYTSVNGKRNGCEHCLKQHSKEEILNSGELVCVPVVKLVYTVVTFRKPLLKTFITFRQICYSKQQTLLGVVQKMVLEKPASVRGFYPFVSGGLTSPFDTILFP
jgi:hypothetical protein